ALARELGLEKPNVRDKKRGFSDAKIAPATALVYADLIAELDAGLLPYITEPFEVPGTRRPALDLPEETPVSGLEPGGSEVGETEDISHAPAARSGARRRVQCGCPEPRKLSITPAQLDIGPIPCGLRLRRFATQACNPALCASNLGCTTPLCVRLLPGAERIDPSLVLCP